MKKNLLILFIYMSFSLTINAQNVFYGYPSDDVKLGEEDKIIVSIPDHWDGKFNNTKDLEELLNYICSSDLTLKIKVIVFRGAKDFSIAYSEALCSDLKKRLFDRCCNKDGCQIVPIGKAEPLYHDKSNIGKYYKHNTRIEIIIE